MQIRGGTLQTQSVWDDTDIVHYLEDTIYIADMGHYGGLRIESSPNESLVVKLNGGGAGFEATGRPLEIEDRVGGMLHIVGAPLFPVVLTSIHDDTVGAGFDPRGFPQNDTNNNGAATTPGPGDWDSVLINQFAHDRNVQIIAEQELNQDVAPGVGDTDGFFVGYRAGTPFLFNFNVTNGIPADGARTGADRVLGSRTNFQEIGPVGADIQGMAFVGGTLYGVDDNGVLYTISTGTGFASFVANLGQNEIQQIETVNDPTMGTFTLEFGGDVTNALDFDATAAEIQNELQMLPSLVTDEVQIVGSSDLIGGGAPTSGDYDLSIAGFGTAVDIPFNANAAAVELALETATGIAAADLTVTGTLGGGFTLSFINGEGDTNIPQTDLISTDLVYPSGLANDVEQTVTEGGVIGINVTSRFGGNLSQSPMLVEFRNQFDNTMLRR